LIRFLMSFVGLVAANYYQINQRRW